MVSHRKLAQAVEWAGPVLWASCSISCRRPRAVWGWASVVWYAQLCLERHHGEGARDDADVVEVDAETVVLHQEGHAQGEGRARAQSPHDTSKSETLQL